MTLQIIGLVYDAAGIATLAASSLYKIIDHITEQTGTKWDYNRELAKAFAYARVDTLTGSTLLLLGFIIQIVSLLGIYATQSCGYLLLGSLAIITILYWTYIRTKVSEYIIDEVEERHEEGIEATK